MRRQPAPPRRGLPPALTALLVLAVAGVAAAVGLVVGSAGGPGRSPPARPAAAEEGRAGERAERARPLPRAEADGAEPSSAAGARVFRERCASCHTIGGGRAGAEGGDLAEAALRRDPRWVRAMVERPDSMFRADSAARRLLEVHGVAPSRASSDDPELRALLSYLRTFDPGR